MYLEALQNPEFDYNRNLQYGGHSGENDKEHYDCVTAQVYNSTSDGKFEKQLVNLKPATTYYYRAYVRIGSNVNYSEVRNFVTQNPASEIAMSTNDATDIFAVSAVMNGIVNVGNLQDVNENQAYGFIYTDAEQMKTPETLTYEYYTNWSINHFETEEEFDAPSEVIATSNLNGHINFEKKGLTPGKTYYYRSFFRWNNKYFYSPTVKSFKTLGSSEIHVGTDRATDVTATSATLNASVPFSKIGLDNVKAVFMISSKYSNASEFVMGNLYSWEDRNRHPNEDVYYLETTINTKDYSVVISGLLPETTYYVRSAVKIGRFDNEDFWIYGTMQHFKTESAESGFAITSTGTYPWIEYQPGFWESGNTGVGNSISELTVIVDHQAGEILQFTLAYDTEPKYDVVTVTCDGVPIGRYSGNSGNAKTVNCPFSTAGTSVVTITYEKDGSVNTGEDIATVGYFRIRY